MKNTMLPLFLVFALALVGCKSSSTAPDDVEVAQEAPVEKEKEDEDEEEKEEEDEEELEKQADEQEQTEAQEQTGLVLDEKLTDEWEIGDAYRGQVELSGYLRFSWLTSWDSAGDVQKQLVMRFFVDEEGQKALPEEALPVGPDGEAVDHPPVISLYVERDGRELSDADIAKMRALIEEDFEHVPENFNTYQEGHAQQAGTLVMEQLLVEKMADQPYFHGRLVSFEPEAMDEDPEKLQERLDAQAYAAGSQQGAVYEEDFFFTEPGVIYAEPDADSDSVAEVDTHQMLTKIRTVDEQWMEVSFEGDEQTSGFVRRDALEPVN